MTYETAEGMAYPMGGTIHSFFRSELSEDHVNAHLPLQQEGVYFLDKNYYKFTVSLSKNANACTEKD